MCNYSLGWRETGAFPCEREVDWDRGGVREESSSSDSETHE